MKSPDWPYLAPFFVFAVFLAGEGWFPNQHYLIYPFQTLAVAAAILMFRRSLPNLRPSLPLLSALVGVVGVALWIGLSRCPWLVHYDQPVIGRNPFALYPAAAAWGLFAFRMIGFSVTTPIMEELFWRGFLMRWLIREDFTSVPLGAYRPLSFWVTTACFAAVHGVEWPLAVVVGILYGAWFVRTKNLGNIILAHSVTNLLLGLYCLAANDWHFLSTIAPVHS